MTRIDAWGFATGTPAPAPDDRGRVPETAEPDRATHTTAGTRPATPTAAGRRPAHREGDEPQRTARAALTRILEPGDETAGRWLRERGPVALWHTLSDDTADPPAGATPAKIAGLRLRAGRARPTADLDAITALGGRFVSRGRRVAPPARRPRGRAARRPVGAGAANLRCGRCGPWPSSGPGLHGVRRPHGVHPRRGAGRARMGRRVRGCVRRGRRSAPRVARRGRGDRRRAGLRGGPALPPRAHPVDRQDRRTGAGGGRVTARRPPDPSRFILRNRVIAALTRGTVVVEAAHRSGALVTARAAQRLGRYTMGVPGPATSGLSAGVHELLRGEAALVTDAAEVVELVGDMGELAPTGGGPYCRVTCWSRRQRGCWPRCPARGPPRRRRSPGVRARRRTTRSARLYELRSLGSSNDTARLEVDTPGHDAPSGGSGDDVDRECSAVR